MANIGTKYLESGNIKIYPSAFRSNIGTNPESYLNTEFNLTHLKQLSQYSINNNYCYKEGNNFVFYIDGYYFEVINTNDEFRTFITNTFGLPTSVEQPKYLYAYIRLEDQTTQELDDSTTPPTVLGTIYKNKILIKINGGENGITNIPLDAPDDQLTNRFYGLGFTDNAADITGKPYTVFTINYSEDENHNPIYTFKGSYIKLSTSEIRNGVAISDIDISQQFNTVDLSVSNNVSTDKLSVNSISVQNESAITLKSNILPESTQTINFGNDSKQFNDINTATLHVDTITNTSNSISLDSTYIIPESGKDVYLGNTSNGGDRKEFKGICTELLTMNNLKGKFITTGANRFELNIGGDNGNNTYVIPEIDKVYLGKSTNYFKETYTSTLFVDNITRKQATSTIGAAGSEFANIYATTFTGALNGNAATASKWQTARNINITGFVTGSALVDGSTDITIDASLKSGKIVTDDIADNAITKDKIANLSVTTGKLDNNAVTATQLADNAVETDKIKNLAVTNEKLADGIDVEKLTANSITIGTSKPVVLGNTIADITGLGTISADSVTAGVFNATSDKRLKENIEVYEPINSILDLPLFKYDFINGEKNKIGCLAQDLQELFPELVHKNENGYLTIEENKLVYLLIYEVKQLKEQLESLK